MIKLTLLLAGVLLFLNASVFAEDTVYVTDSLRLRIYSEPNDKSTVLQTLNTGDSIELIESKGAFSHVRTYDGITGWAKSAFLVINPPAVLLNQALVEQNYQLELQIRELKSSNVANSTIGTEKIINLEKGLEKEKRINETLHSQLGNLDKQLLQQQHAKNSIHFFDLSLNYSAANDLLKKISVLVFVILGLIVFGFSLGMKQATRRLRKRLHGYRLG